MIGKLPTLDELRADYDWQHAFYEAASQIGDADGDGTSLERFAIDEVTAVLALSEGEGEGPSWLAIVKLGGAAGTRYAYIEAGCDYTGWDCQASGQSTVSSVLERVVRYGCTDDARGRFKGDKRTHARVLKAIKKVEASR
jgi:hypothetical protein